MRSLCLCQADWSTLGQVLLGDGVLEMEYHYDLNVEVGERPEDIEALLHAGEIIQCRGKSVSKMSLQHRDELLFYLPGSRKRFMKLRWHNPFSYVLKQAKNSPFRIRFVNACFVKKTTYGRRN